MKHLLAAAALVALLLFLMTRNVSPDPYPYDEADYMYAASLGYFANWMDTPTLPLPEFLRIGLGRGRQAGRRRIGLRSGLAGRGTAQSDPTRCAATEPRAAPARRPLHGACHIANRHRSLRASGAAGIT